MGSSGTYASYIRNAMRPTIPRTSGTRIWADDQGNWTPPQVKPIIVIVVDPTTSTFPLIVFETDSASVLEESW